MRKTKKEKRQVFIITVLAILLVACAVIIYLGYTKLKDMDASSDAMRDEMALNQRTVYVATANIMQGDQLLEGTNIAMQTIYSGLDSTIYMTEDQVGYKALVNIPLGDAVQTNMIGENDISSDTREYEVDVVTLMTNQVNSDIVDVRIMFPDGSDYIVLSKKTISNLSLDNSIFYTDLTEDEILRMASATIDAYQTEGAKLYTTRYVQPTLQDESIPFYPVKENVIDLIHSDPNILEVAQETLNASARADLESRIASVSDEDKSLVTSGNDTVEQNKAAEISADASTETTEETTEDDSYGTVTVDTETTETVTTTTY